MKTFIYLRANNATHTVPFLVFNVDTDKQFGSCICVLPTGSPFKGDLCLGTRKASQSEVQHKWQLKLSSLDL